MVTLVSGTMFLVWLGEQISERGIGNGISMIIFAGIVAGLPSASRQYTLELTRTGAFSIPFSILSYNRCSCFSYSIGSFCRERSKTYYN